jgi:uncharacterized SAM-binding protein YcdF (DUF218 family)
MVFIHHLLQSFVLPPLNSVIIIIMGVGILKKKLDLGKIFILIGCITLYIQSTPFFVYTIAAILEQPTITKLELNKTQAFVVLGGGIRTNAYEYPEKFTPNSFTLMRLQYTAFLAKQYPNIPIIVSGGIASANNHSEAQIMKNTLQNNFNIINPILIEEKSRNTKENAKYVSQMLKELNYNNIAVITQAYHSSRATALFKQYGVNVIAAPTDYMGHYARIITVGNFIPDAGTMADCSALLHEILGYLIYVRK